MSKNIPCAVTLVTRTAPKIGQKVYSFGEKLPLNEKNIQISLQNDSYWQRFTYSCQGSWKTVKHAEVIKAMRGIPRRKGLVFCLFFSGAPGTISPKILQRHPFPTPHPAIKFRRNSSSFREDMRENVVYSLSNIGVKRTGTCSSVAARKFCVILKPISQLRFDYDTTATRLRRKIDVNFLLALNRVEWKQARAIRRSLVVVVSQSNRNFDHFRCSRMRRGIVVYDVS